MGRSGARLDAYAHHPYALTPTETPWSGGCAKNCETITMATIGRLLTETQKAFKRPLRHLADGARLPGESSRPHPRRVAGEAGHVYRGRRVQGMGDPAESIS